MIVPSIDLMGGQAVQLVGGREHALDAGDPIPIAERFSVAGEIAVIDLDAALGRGSNAKLIRALVKRFPCRVGGGIRDVDTARAWLDAGARKVILGTRAVPEVLRELPGERVIAALDAVEGEVVDEGWTHKTGRNVVDRMREVREFVGGFLVTFVEREGRMQGSRLDRVEELVREAKGSRVTVAGGVTTAAEVGEIDAFGADAQVGMALYTGAMDLGDAIAAPMRSDRADGLWPTVVVDELGVALGLVYSSAASVREAVRSMRGVYHSRSRGGLWIKGDTSGDVQELLGIRPDCDRDALRFTVRQRGRGFCHEATRACWGEAHDTLGDLARRLEQRRSSAPAGSYSARLFADTGLLRAKLLEEAAELADADVNDADGVAHETADVLYFALVAAARAGVSLERVHEELDRRALRVTRRPGDAKKEHSE